MPTAAVTVRVSYEHAEDYHIFTSAEVGGLFIASKDQEKAFDSVAPAIEALVLEAEGTSMVVEPAMTFDEFFGIAGRDE